VSVAIAEERRVGHNVGDSAKRVESDSVSEVSSQTNAQTQTQTQTEAEAETETQTQTQTQTQNDSHSDSLTQKKPKVCCVCDYVREGIRE
jgi:carbohydrate-binding DOMON domain-containing protein